MASREDIREVLLMYKVGELSQTETLEELGKLGVVIKVDRELPAISWNSNDPVYDIAYAKGIGAGRGNILGFTAWKPLKEG